MTETGVHGDQYARNGTLEKIQASKSYEFSAIGQ